MWFLFVCCVHSKALGLNTVTGATLKLPVRICLDGHSSCRRCFLVTGRLLHQISAPFLCPWEIYFISHTCLSSNRYFSQVPCLEKDSKAYQMQQLTYLCLGKQPRLPLNSTVSCMPDQKAARLSGPSYKNSVTNSFSLNWS